MSFKVLRTDKFNDQLQDIVLYVKTSFSKNDALSYLNFLEEQINNLSEFPELGTIPRYQPIAKQGYRSLVSKKNIIFYKVNNETKTITLHLIVTASENYLNLI